jgi:flagellin-like protein
VSRALSPVVGTVTLIAVVVLAATAVGALVTVETPATSPVAQFSVTADAGTDRIALTHEGGDTVAVSALSVSVTVDGRPLAHQPPVPFFAARGFESGPTGPFNSASDDDWSAGERATVSLASTNSPRLAPGASVEVRLSTDRGVVAAVETTAT